MPACVLVFTFPISLLLLLAYLEQCSPSTYANFFYGHKREAHIRRGGELPAVMCIPSETVASRVLKPGTSPSAASLASRAAPSTSSPPATPPESPRKEGRSEAVAVGVGGELDSEEEQGEHEECPG